MTIAVVSPSHGGNGNGSGPTQQKTRTLAKVTAPTLEFCESVQAERRRLEQDLLENDLCDIQNVLPREARSSLITMNRRVSMGRRRSSIGFTGRGVLPLSESEQNRLADMYRTVLQLTSDNSQRLQDKAWQMDLIDLMPRLLPTYGKDNVNFQKASVTLDASVRLYATRVDATAAASKRMLMQLARSGVEEIISEDEGDNTTEEGKKRKSKKDRLREKLAAAHLHGSDGISAEVILALGLDESSDPILAENINDSSLPSESLGAKVGSQEKCRLLGLHTTLSKDVKSINKVVGENDDVVVDPAFHRTGKAFDEGGAKGMLLYNLRLSRQSSSLAFIDKSLEERWEEEEQSTSSKAGTRLIDMADLVNRSRVSASSLQSMEIATPLTKYRNTLNIPTAIRHNGSGKEIGYDMPTRMPPIPTAFLPVCVVNNVSTDNVESTELDTQFESPLPEFERAQSTVSIDAPTPMDMSFDNGCDNNVEEFFDNDYVVDEEATSFIGGARVSASPISPEDNGNRFKLNWNEDSEIRADDDDLMVLNLVGMGSSSEYAFFNIDSEDLRKKLHSKPDNSWSGSRHWNYALRRRTEKKVDSAPVEENSNQMVSENVIGADRISRKSKDPSIVDFAQGMVDEALFGTSKKSSRGRSKTGKASDPTLMPELLPANHKSAKSQVTLPVDSRMSITDLSKLFLFPRFVATSHCTKGSLLEQAVVFKRTLRETHCSLLRGVLRRRDTEHVREMTVTHGMARNLINCLRLDDVDNNDRAQKVLKGSQPQAVYLSDNSEQLRSQLLSQHLLLPQSGGSSVPSNAELRQTDSHFGTDGGMNWDDGIDYDNDDDYIEPQIDFGAIAPTQVISAAAAVAESNIENATNNNGLQIDQSKLLQPVRTVGQIRVNHATVARNTDVRALRERLWKALNVPAPSSMEVNTSAPEEESMSVQNTNTDLTQSMDKLSFRDTIEKMQATGQEKDTSISYYFICLLHLANEQGLAISSHENLADLSISKPL